MGEYFNWVNVDKKEYLCPNDFGYGNKSHETRHKNNPVLRALHELLSSRWCGDQVTGQGTVLCLNGMVEKTQKNGFQSCGRGS